MPVVLAEKKSRITVNAMYNTGIPVSDEKVFVAQSRLLQTPVENFRAVELTLIIPVSEAEDLFNSFSTGDVEILVQDIPPKT